MESELTQSGRVPKKNISIHSDIPNYDSCITAKINRDKDIVEISIDGKSIFLDDDNVKFLANHLLELIK